jgi:hypothetical protein
VNGGPFVPDDCLTYSIPDEALKILTPILRPYGADPMWYFDRLNSGRPPAPWALVCLDREHAIAGHIAQTRSSRNDIAVVAYHQPVALAPGDPPPVGVLVLFNKSGLERVKDKSPAYEAAWQALSGCSAAKRWLVTLDPLPEDWLAKVEPTDAEAWRSRSMPGNPSLPTSVEKAIKVSDVAEEYAFIRTAACLCGAPGDLELEMQSLVRVPQPIDRMDVRCRVCGAKLGLYFDVSDTPVWRGGIGKQD